MKSVSLEYRSTTNSESCLCQGDVCSLEVSSKTLKYWKNATDCNSVGYFARVNCKGPIVYYVPGGYGGFQNSVVYENRTPLK